MKQSITEKSKIKKFLKFIPLIAVSYGLLILFMLFGIMTDLVPQSKNIDKADVNATFEKDYEDLLKVAEYMIALEDESVWIRNPNKPMSVDLGEKRDIDPEIKSTVRKLFRRGYMNIIKNDTSVVFERWKRPFSFEFRAGFAYNYRGTDWVDVQFRINQQKLDRADWYYYEEDYNQWRVNH